MFNVHVTNMMLINKQSLNSDISPLYSQYVHICDLNSLLMLVEIYRMFTNNHTIIGRRIVFVIIIINKYFIIIMVNLY